MPPIKNEKFGADIRVDKCPLLNQFLNKRMKWIADHPAMKEIDKVKQSVTIILAFRRNLKLKEVAESGGYNYSSVCTWNTDKNILKEQDRLISDFSDEFTWELFDRIGGADERFDFPGGGFVNLDLFREATEQQDTSLVYIMGEASFHQVHGGTTTNVAPEERERRVAVYREQYRDIRSREFAVAKKAIEYVGHLPNEARHRPQR